MIDVIFRNKLYHKIKNWMYYKHLPISHDEINEIIDLFDDYYLSINSLDNIISNAIHLARHDDGFDYITYIKRKIVNIGKEASISNAESRCKHKRKKKKKKNRGINNETNI